MRLTVLVIQQPWVRIISKIWLNFKSSYVIVFTMLFRWNNVCIELVLIDFKFVSDLQQSLDNRGFISLVLNLQTLYYSMSSALCTTAVLCLYTGVLYLQVCYRSAVLCSVRSCSELLTSERSCRNKSNHPCSSPVREQCVISVGGQRS